jgi:muramoyltetrapeptide carboxypeptidase
MSSPVEHPVLAAKKHIYVYSPSGAVRDKVAFRRGVARLTAMGHAVEVDGDALTRFTRFAGDDATRLAAIQRAADSGADVALISRGGYGLTRLLPDLPYEKIAVAIERGTAFVGLSDFTAFQLAMLAKTGSITWAGPALGEDFGTKDEVDDIMLACFDDLLQRQCEGTGWQLKPRPAAADIAKGGLNIKGRLWGGNLAVLVSLIGTPYFPKVRDGILFIEDVAEYPWRIERMLTQLLHAGILAKQRAIIFGQFTGYKATPHDKGFKLQTVVSRLQTLVACPVLQGLPFGHVSTKVLLPVGTKVQLLTDNRDGMLLWDHLEDSYV